MIPIAENPAVTNPHATLSKVQRDALCTIAFFKQLRPVGHLVQVGNKRFKPSTIASLKRLELVRGQVPSLAPTLAGQLAIDKLKGGQ